MGADIFSGVVDAIGNAEIDERIRSGEKLVVKAGLDPTAPDIHLGHTLVLSKLREFQKMGHEAVLVVGDFTACIGDPTGKSATRKPLTRAEVLANAKTYMDQAFLILDPVKTRVVLNSSWLDGLTSREVIELSSSYTVARMMERDDFSQRFKNGLPIAIHEFIYPLLQGYDSVFLKSDVEIGGTDQLFNMLVGRDLQRQRGLRQQAVLTVPLLEGLDGVKKMSKSLGNYIGVAESPEDMFGKIMSISDDLMWRYIDLLMPQLLGGISDCRARVASGALHPMHLKKTLSEKLVERFHGAAMALAARANFDSVVSRKEAPADIREVALSCAPRSQLLVTVLREAGLVDSATKAKALIRQGAVRIDGVKVDDENLRIDIGSEHLYQVGKRNFARVTFSVTHTEDQAGAPEYP